MIRRSGRFNYEIVPYAQSNFQKGQDPSGPVGGWHTHVKKHRGRKNVIRGIQSVNRSNYGHDK